MIDVRYGVPAGYAHVYEPGRVSRFTGRMIWRDTLYLAAKRLGLAAYKAKVGAGKKWNVFDGLVVAESDAHRLADEHYRECAVETAVEYIRAAGLSKRGWKRDAIKALLKPDKLVRTPSGDAPAYKLEQVLRVEREHSKQFGVLFYQQGFSKTPRWVSERAGDVTKIVERLARKGEIDPTRMNNADALLILAEFEAAT